MRADVHPGEPLATASRGLLAQRLDGALLALLALFAFTIPLAEAPKNIAGALFLLAWVLRVAASGSFGGRWDRFDTALAAMLVSAGLSAFIGGYAGDLGGVLRVLVVAWAVKRSPLTPRAAVTVLAAACAGLAIGLVIGAADLLRGSRDYLELPSVGFVNQSALYLAVLACAALGWSLQEGGGRARGWRLAILGCALCFGVALLVSASRAALLAAVVFVAGLLGAFWLGQGRQARRVLAVVAAVAVCSVALLWLLPKLDPQLSGRKLQVAELVNTDSIASRLLLWNLAVEGWRHRPWFGFGPESFQRITPEEACSWREQRGEPCDRASFASDTHAHSLYLSTLAERGMVGVAALALLLGTWLWALVRSAAQARSSPLWVASAAGLAVVAIGGLFNTTLRVEHGSLALLMLGLWLSERRPAVGCPAALARP